MGTLPEAQKRYAIQVIPSDDAPIDESDIPEEDEVDPVIRDPIGNHVEDARRRLPMGDPPVPASKGIENRPKTLRIPMT